MHFCLIHVCPVLQSVFKIHSGPQPVCGFPKYSGRHSQIDLSFTTLQCVFGPQGFGMQGFGCGSKGGCDGLLVDAMGLWVVELGPAIGVTLTSIIGRSVSLIGFAVVEVVITGIGGNVDDGTTGGITKGITVHLMNGSPVYPGIQLQIGL